MTGSVCLYGQKFDGRIGMLIRHSSLRGPAAKFFDNGLSIVAPSIRRDGRIVDTYLFLESGVTQADLLI